MEPCVISYLPGAGANRLARWFAGNDWLGNPDGHAHSVPFTPGFINYAHSKFLFIKPDFSTIPSTTYTVAFTHCMNSELVRKYYPDRKLIKLRADFWDCMGRAWHVQARDEAWTPKIRRGLPVSKAINMFLNWNIDYYQETGLDWDGDEVYDIENSDHEFCVAMRDMLKKQQDPDYIKFMAIYRGTRARLPEF